MSYSKVGDAASPANALNPQTCASITDYEAELKNGSSVSTPCEIISSNLPRCLGEHSVSTWSNCYGERVTPKGGTYKGGYRDGKANGKGEFVNPDGSRYLGKYAIGLRNGYGKEYAINGAILKEGKWINGKFIGDSQINKSERGPLPSTSSSMKYTANDSVNRKVRDSEAISCSVRVDYYLRSMNYIYQWDKAQGVSFILPHTDIVFENINFSFNRPEIAEYRTDRLLIQGSDGVLKRKRIDCVYDRQAKQFSFQIW